MAMSIQGIQSLYSVPVLSIDLGEVHTSGHFECVSLVKTVEFLGLRNFL